MFLNAFNSIALPDGSLKKAMDCSPTSFSNLIVGSIRNSIFFSLRSLVIVLKSFQLKTSPKWGTGMSLESTEFVISFEALSLRCQTN